MGVREYDYIRGNTVLAPERKIFEEEKNREQIKKRIEEQKRVRSLKKRITKEVISVAMLIAVLGGATIGIDSYVYNIQKELGTLEDSLKEENDINEAIKVDLLKISSIDNINKAAEKQIGMVYPDKSSTLTIDMSKEYFSHIKDENTNNKGTNLLAKILGTFN